MLTIDDLVFAFKSNLACRHVSSPEAFHHDLSSDVLGDAYAIGAVNMLTYTAEQRAHDGAFQDALMERLVAAFSGGPKEIDTIKAGGERLVQAYESEIRRMVGAAVDYDDRHGSATECHLILYKDVSGAASPYDINKYPFGKCGKAILHHDKVIAGAFLDESEKEALHGNKAAIIECLTGKLLAAISKSRTRANLAESGAGEIHRGGERTDPKPREGGWAENS